MTILRTPDEQFADLVDYDFASRYVVINGLRLHYLDEGPRDAAPVLLLHGEPTWSYLYRKVIPALVQAGQRAVAPDYIGFGKSDKLAAIDDYSYQLHVDLMAEFIQALDLRGITLVGQDWGGLIGLRVLVDQPERFARVVTTNTGLPTGDKRLPEVWRQFRDVVLNAPDLSISRLVQAGCHRELPEAVLTAYDAPFPDERYKAGARAFPKLVPTHPNDPGSVANLAAWQVLMRLDLPFLTAFSDGDPITRGADKLFRRLVPGAKGQPHTVIKDAGHFVQEDKGEELAAVIVDFIARTKGTMP